MTIQSLTGLRFVAIVLIYFHHIGCTVGLGAVGVTFFFVLSGFIIAYNYNLIFNRIDTKNLQTFYVRRFSKIYPLHVLTFLASLPVVYLSNFKTNAAYAFLHIFLLQSSFPNGKQVFAFNGLAWFISNILIFYLATPFVLYILNKFQIAKSKKALIKLLIIVFILETLLSYMFVNKVQAFSTGWWFVYISPYFRFLDYLMGIISGLIFFSLKNNSFKLKAGKALFGILEVLSILSVFAAIYGQSFFPFDAMRYGAYFVPSLVLTIFIFSFQHGFLSTILSTRLFVNLGNLSFTIYLIHQLAISYTAIFFSSRIIGMKSDPRQITAQILLLFVIICLSDVIARYFEKPVQSVILKRFGQSIETTGKPAAN